MLDFLKKKKQETPNALLDKVRTYADEIASNTDVESLQMATLESIAAHNAMKEEAQSHVDEELVKLLMPFSDFFANSVVQATERCASNKHTELELSLRCLDWAEHDPLKGESYYSDDDRGDAAIRIGKTLTVRDVVYSFSEELHAWEYFYWLVGWIKEKLEERGFVVTGKRYYTMAHPDSPWSDEMDYIKYSVLWGDADFAENAKKLNDPSQVEAFKSGVPLADILA